MGGIVAQYPTRAPFHYPSAFLPAGRDLFGDVLREAHARRIRVIGRFDLSKTQKAVYDAHPEWFFRRANGEPAIYNGLYSTCINGDYYRRHALTILTEALERYEVDGLFFNMFGNPATDYSGVAMGPCACDACRVRFRARTGRDVPAQADAEYRAFMADSAREVAATHRRPDPREAAAGRVPHLHRRSHRRHHVGVEHRGGPAAAAVALLGQRQRAPGARLRAGQGGDQPVDGVRGLPVALRARGGGRDRSCASTRTSRTAGRRRWPSSARWRRRIAPRSRRRRRCSRGTRGTRISTSASGTRPACCSSPPATRRRIAGSSACSPSSTSPSRWRRTCAASPRIPAASTS